MANTTYAVGANEAVKLWSRVLFREALKTTWAYKFMGRDSNSIIQIVEDTSKGPGDRVRCILRMLLSADGVSGDGTLEGNEEALVTHTDDLLIDQLRTAVRSAGKMTEQRIPFSIRDEARMGLQDWWSDRIDTAFFNQICGMKTAPNTNTKEVADVRYTGMQAPLEPDSDHQMSKADQDGATLNTTVSSSALSFSIDLIDVAVEKAKTLSPLIKPVKVGGDDMYVCFVHPYQARAMRQNYDSGQWGDIQKAILQGGRISDNPILSGALGIYNNVIIHESTRIPQALDDSGTVLTSTRRAVFCGAQAATMAFGRGFGPSRMSWTEEMFDYGNSLGVAAGMIWGLKKTRYNSKDFGTIAIDTQAMSA